MPFPGGVVLTTVFGEYLDVAGKPAKGVVIFLPDLSAIGEGISVAPIAVRKKFDSSGKFTQAIPASVNTGLDPDFTYKVTWQFDGGEYRSKIVQIPVSASPVNIDDLIEVAPSSPVPRFQLPMYAAAPATPQPGQMYYNTVEGAAYVYDDVADVWVDLTATGGGGGGAPSGPAGGSLAGTYPNPTLAANSVGTTQLANLSVTAAKLSVSYVPTITHNADLATIAQALGDLEDMDTTLAGSIAGKANTVHTHVTSDVTDLQGLLNLKAPLASPVFTGTVTGITSGMVGLGNVNNTSDANKPVSTATQTALNGKEDTGVAATAVEAHRVDTTNVHGITDTANLVLTNDARLTNARTPTAHAVSHQDGGADELALDGSQITSGTVAIARIPTGQTGSTVPFGNDARFTDARTPIAHAASHADGGTDEISIDGSQVTSGTVVFARLPTGSGAAQVAVGTHDHNGVYQPVDADLTTIAGLTATTDNMIQSVGSAWASRTPAQVKTTLALNNVDNTSDANKPVSSATNTALGLKANLASPAFTGTPTAPTATPATNNTQIASTAYVDAAVAAGGGGGGTAATFQRAYITTGNVGLVADATWTPLTGLTWSIAAVNGDDVETHINFLTDNIGSAADFLDIVILVGGVAVRYASSGTSSPAAGNEGDPSLYPDTDIRFQRNTTSWGLTVVTGDLSGGNVTFGLAHRGTGGGTAKVFADANYPFRWRIRNDH